MLWFVGLLWLSFLTHFRYMCCIYHCSVGNVHRTFKIQFDLWHWCDSSFFLNASTYVKPFNRALLNRLFKDVSNYEIVKVLTPHFIVAKHAGGADLECGLQTSTRHDGHNSIHSQLRLGEKEGPQGFPLIPCHVCGWLLFSKVNQWFCSVSTHSFLYCYHLWMILEHCIYYFPFKFCSGCRAERG